ncbi:pseudouridine synthase [Lactarius sanguifluus]|nr:pseudouridine synthase [Lactarius sanguifluus]
MAPDAVPALAPAHALARPGLRKIAPYWYSYTTMTKGRWLDREILEVVSTEFRDRSIEYYRCALESGVTTINGKIAKPGTIVRNGDRIENVVHRREPLVTSRPVKILHEDRESEFIVIDKPGSIRSFSGNLGTKKFTVRRYRSPPFLSHVLSQEFVQGEVKKEYTARCSGEFPAEEVVVDQPLLTVDRRMGLNIVHPDGKIEHAKPAQTIFTRLHYDKNTNTSVLHCRPLTGHSHQIRVHLQYLGYPIANDPGPNLGKGGIGTTPSDDRAPPVAPAHLVGTDTADSTRVAPESDPGTGTSVHPSPQLLPRETGKDIGMGSPVPLSAETVGVITRLCDMKQQQQQPVPLTEEEALAILDPASPPAESPLRRVAPPPDVPTESGSVPGEAVHLSPRDYQSWGVLDGNAGVGREGMAMGAQFLRLGPVSFYVVARYVQSPRCGTSGVLYRCPSSRSRVLAPDDSAPRRMRKYDSPFPELR